MGKSRKKKIVVWSAAALLATLIAIFAYIPFAVMNPMVNRHVDFDETWSAADFGLTARPFSVTTGTDCASRPTKSRSTIPRR